MSSPGTLFSSLSNGDIIGSTDISLLDLLTLSVDDSACLLFALFLFSLSKSFCCFSCLVPLLNYMS